MVERPRARTSGQDSVCDFSHSKREYILGRKLYYFLCQVHNPRSASIARAAIAAVCFSRYGRHRSEGQRRAASYSAPTNEVEDMVTEIPSEIHVLTNP